MGTDLFFKGREDGWLQYTKYRGVKVKPNFKMKCNKLLMVLFVHSVLQNLFKRLGFEAFQNVREVFLEALKLIQMKTSFKYDFYLKLSLVTDIGLNSDKVDHSPIFIWFISSRLLRNSNGLGSPKLHLLFAKHI